MRAITRGLGASLLAVTLTAASVAPALATGPDVADYLDPGYPGLRTQWGASEQVDTVQGGELRAAVFNVSLSRGYAGALAQDLSIPGDEHASAAAEVIQRTRPDVVLLNDFDYDDGHDAAQAFSSNYLQQGQNGQRPIDYPYVYVAPNNNGVATGADLDGNGTVGDPADGFGVGDFAGQHGMVLYSRYPIDRHQVRTFQNMLWKSMPGNQMPHQRYSGLVRNVMRLNSTTTWDVPVKVDGTTVHVIAANPVAPVDEAGTSQQKRNADQIRLLSDYVSGGAAATYITDDRGQTGGLARDSRFVVLGDLAADPAHGPAAHGAVKDLLGNPAVTDPRPASDGAAEAAGAAGGTADHDAAAPELLTSTPAGGAALRTDYALPSTTLALAGAGVFWPSARQDGRSLVFGDPAPSGNHRLVWVDVDLPEAK
ncbi:endonuclease/exonuclease/phosphatase family protein [Arthrobacter sp.]|uniref:endonuclease/exonuclease/phosphatase family protein n=1 Tax=Arthrobacter sp. TaxID=1667 RepID=UPI003A8EC29A